ncbi:MAG: hypothetical protein JWN34_2334 [Bryobacterales bacterium]|nr:hypothetical protein [Bryobacterales bacterium]
MVGLDLGLAVIDQVAGDLSNASRAPELYRRKVEEGNLGVKRGRASTTGRRKTPRKCGRAVTVSSQRPCARGIGIIRKCVS